MDKEQDLNLERLDLKSHDIAGQKRLELLRLFPEVRTEGGKIDFDKLKAALGEMVDAGRERYGMNWPGKAECMRTIQAPSMATLLPMRAESVDWDTTENVIIEGDNLEVLKLLQKSYLGKIRMIHIDPPYNTGNDFIYPDNYSESLQTYLEYTGQADDAGRRYGPNTETDGRFHSKWLNMMYPRLYLAKNLLRDDGVIFITIDDVELVNLRRVLDEVFGDENFVAQIEWEKRYTRSNNTDDFTSVIDHICVYQRSDAFKVSLLPRGEEANARFTNPDNDPRGPWKATPFLNQVAPEKRPNLCYPITNPKTGKTVSPTLKAWRYEEAVFHRLLADNRLYWGKEGTREVPDIKTYLSEVREGMTPINLWTHEYAGNTDQANREIKEAFGEKIFDTPKPVQLIRRMLEHCRDTDGIVLDFFAGSGTTAEAVFVQNQADGGSRKFILVQLPEPTPFEKFPTIADMTKFRVAECSRKIKESRTGSLSFDDTASQDLGFRVFKLAETGFKIWDSDTSNSAAKLGEQLSMHINNVNAERTESDLLYEILIKSGFGLSPQVKSIDVGGKRAFSIAGGSLLVCLDKQLTFDAIKAIAELKPDRVVCLDAGFAGNDQLKTNAVQTFKTMGIASFRVV